MYGDLERCEDQWRLRFTRRLPYPKEKVWRAITEAEHLEAWFPQRIVGPWMVGSPLRFKSEYGDFDGEVLRFEPESLVEFRWGPDTIRMEVASDGAGSILTLIDTFSELGKAARDAAGWHTCIDFLERHLDGTEAPWDSRQRWEKVHPGYVDKFGPEAATAGPPV
jgi:uncharacterized protein YndB with AHSA1/START domain